MCIRDSISTLLAGLTIFGSTGILNSAGAQFIAYLTVNLGWNASIVSNAFSLRTLLDVYKRQVQQLHMR